MIPSKIVPPFVAPGPGGKSIGQREPLKVTDGDWRKGTGPFSKSNAMERALGHTALGSTSLEDVPWLAAKTLELSLRA
jgi:hypothetical protein